MSHNDTNQNASTQKPEMEESKTVTTTSVSEVKKDTDSVKEAPAKQDTPKTESPKVPTVQKTEPTKVEPQKAPEEKKAPVVETPKAPSTPTVVHQQPEQKKSSSIKVGVKCKLKDSVTVTVNNQTIPAFAYRNTYVVSKILRDRILIKAGLTYTLAVKDSDITLI